MIYASRKIIENSNDKLLINTEKEIGYLEQLFYENTEDLEEKINRLLNNKEINYIEKINTLLEENKDIVAIRRDLQVLEKIVIAENYENSVFSKLKKIEDIYIVYKQVSLLLKRIEFGYVEEVKTYIEAICNTYGLCEDDILVSLEVDLK